MRRTQPFSKRHRESAVGPRDASARAVYCSEPADQKRKKTVSNTEGGITCGFSGSSRIAILMGMAGRDAIIYHLTVKRTKFRTCSFAMEYKVNAFVTCLLHCVVHSLLVSLRIFDSICNARCGPTKVTIILPFLQKLWLHARIGFL